MRSKFVCRVYSKIFILFVWFMFLGSCSQMQSGQYVKLLNGETVETVSQKYNLPAWEIEIYNQGKKFYPGDLIFIPSNRGIVPLIRTAPDRVPSYYSKLYKDGEFIWPVPASYEISSPYGSRWGKEHSGIDIRANSGSHIFAANDGVVVYSGDDYSGYGNIIVVAHRYGFFSIYAHNKKNMVSEGDQVVRGQVIGQVGSTGRSTGPHLHFEIRKDSEPIDPVHLVRVPGQHPLRNGSKGWIGSK